jgi:hypothetical protein
MAPLPADNRRPDSWFETGIFGSQSVSWKRTRSVRLGLFDTVASSFKIGLDLKAG